MPNAFAYIVLLSWPIVALVLYLRMPVERAFVWTIIGGYLVLPPLDKFYITNVAAFLLTITIGKRKVRLLPKSKTAAALVLLFILSTIPSVMTNPDPIILRAREANEAIAPGGIRVLPGLGFHEIFYFTIEQIWIILPFLIGRELLSTAYGRRELLRGLMIGALVYMIPSLIEVRMSPQINVWVYGFFQHDFIQMIRDGGYRPIVFLPHALWLAFFMVTAAIAAASLSHSEPPGKRGRYYAIIALLVVMILLCKSMGSIVYMLVMVPGVLMFGERPRARVAVILVTLAMVYPLVRNAGLIPLDDLLDAVTKISDDRAQSLGYRFENEEMLLAHAHEKPWFGWGGWGRNLLYREWDARLETIPDGAWIIILGTGGLLGYLATFGLLAFPVLTIARKMRHPPVDSDIAGLGTLALLLGLTMFDMLLNAPLTPYVWATAGALVGASERWHERSVEAKRQARRRIVTTPLGTGGVDPEKDGPRTVL